MTTPTERGALRAAIDSIHRAAADATGAVARALASVTQSPAEAERASLIAGLEAELASVVAKAPPHVQAWAHDLRARLDGAKSTEARLAILGREAQGLSEQLHRVTERTEAVRAEAGTEAAAT